MNHTISIGRVWEYTIESNEAYDLWCWLLAY